MAAPHPAPLLRHLHRLSADPGADPASDAELLDRFVRARDEAAFAALFARHADLVQGVCRRVLGDAREAEDCLQATFLVLARRAASLRRPAAVAAWLHGVALRVALKARADARRRPATVPLPEAPDRRPDPLDALTARELLLVVEEEIARLPEAYRLAVLLCGAEGRTVGEAARLLGWTAGSVRGRLARGRARLHARLGRRGLLPSAVLAAVAAPRSTAALAAVPRMAATVRAVLTSAGGGPAGGASLSAKVAALAEGATNGMAPYRVKLAAAVLLAVGLAVAATGVLAHAVPAEKSAGQGSAPQLTARDAEPARPGAVDSARVDRYGDPLPPGAVARLGTVRWRHSGEAGALAFSPDGTLLASACTGGAILWDSATGRVRRRLPTSGPLAFSPDGKVLATGARDGAGLWDVAGGELRCTVALPPSDFPDGCRAVRFSPDGKTLAVALGTRAYLIDVATARVRMQLDGHRCGIDDIVFAPDGKSVALAMADSSVRLWDPATGKLIRRFGPDKENPTYRVAFSPDGKVLAVGGRDGIPLLDPVTGDVLGRLEAKMGAVVGLAFTPDGKTLLAAGEAGKVCVWDVPGRKLRRMLDGRGLVGRSLALSPDGKRVALGTAYDAIRLWDVETGRECFTEFDGHDAPVHCVAFTPDGKTLVSGGSNQQTRLWDGATWTQTRLLRGSASTLSFTPDGQRMAAVFNKAVRVWDLAAGTSTLLTLPDTGLIRSALFAADGKTLVSLDVRSDPALPRGVARLVVWDASAGRRLREWSSPEMGSYALALAPDGAAAFVGEPLGPIQMYDLETGEEIRTFTGHGHIVSALALSADGRTLLSGCDDRSARLWEVLTGKEIFALAGHRRTVGAVAFSPDGRLAASAGGSATNSCDDEPPPHKIRLWDVFTGKEVAHFELHTTDVLSLAFSADGSRLVSGLRDGTVLVWDVAALPPLPALAVRADELDGLWKDLAGSDAVKAHQAVWKLSAAPDKAVPFLAERLPSADGVSPERLRQLIADLDSDQFAVRAAAMKELERQGDRAAPALREALAGKPSAEVRKRAEELLAGLHQVRSPEVLRRLRAVQVLERTGSPAARRVLETLAKGSATARETREAKAALGRLTGRAAPAP